MGTIRYVSRSSGAACTVSVAPTVAALTSALAAASDGDVICLQAGNETWSSAVTVDKAVTIRGAGEGQTIIGNNAGSGGRLFNVTLVAGKTTRICHLEFAETEAGTGQGIINVSGSSDQDGSRLRIDHITMNDWGPDVTSGYGIWLQGVLGVIDHCTFNIDDVGHIPIEVQHANWGGQNFGDGSWTEGSNFGTEEFLFVEDCVCNCDNSGFGEAFGGVFVDSLNGDRWVVRYCTMVNCQVGNHGTESGGRQRGGRAMEFYNNDCSGTFPGGIPFHCRSGAMLVHNNTFSDVFYPNVNFFLECKRLASHFEPWDEADGTNAWDKNTAGGPFDSGTATGGSAGVLNDTSKSWTTNQWVGYSLKLTSGCTAGTTEETCSSIIVSNTATSITVKVEGYPPGPFTPASGNTYEIWKVDEALDQPGKGAGSLITGDPPSVPGGWPDQVDDPCYAWDNTGDVTVSAIQWAVGDGLGGEGAVIRLGEHYFALETEKPGYSPYAYPHYLVTD